MQSRRPEEAQEVPATAITGGPAEDPEPVLPESAQINASKDEQHAHKDNDELLNAQCKGLSNGVAVGESQQTNNQVPGTFGKEAEVEDSLRQLMNH